MRTLNLIVITLACLARLPGTHCDDDDEDDCEFIKSFSAKSEAKNLDFTVKDNNARDYCAQWSVIASTSEVIRIDVASIAPPMAGSCRNAYLKIADEKTEVMANMNSQFLLKGPEVSLFFRPGRCLKSFKLTYRSSSNHDWTDEDSSGNHDDKDDDSDSSSSTGRIVGAVVGSVLALILIVVLCALAFMCVRRGQARQAAPGEDVSVHFWSKPSGYTAGTEMGPSTSRDVPHDYDSVSFPSSHKLGPAESGIYHNNLALAPNYSIGTAPAPPPYTGHPTNSATESSHFSKEPPPSYSDAVQSK